MLTGKPIQVEWNCFLADGRINKIQNKSHFYLVQSTKCDRSTKNSSQDFNNSEKPYIEETRWQLLPSQFSLYCTIKLTAFIMFDQLYKSTVLPADN